MTATNKRSALFGSTVRVRVLEAFLHPSKPMYHGRQLERELGDVQINSVRRELMLLHELGILKYETKARLKKFYLNEAFPFVDALRALVIDWRKQQ